VSIKASSFTAADHASSNEHQCFVIPSKVEESRDRTESFAARSLDFAALRSG